MPYLGISAARSMLSACLGKRPLPQCPGKPSELIQPAPVCHLGPEGKQGSADDASKQDLCLMPCSATQGQQEPQQQQVPQQRQPRQHCEHQQREGAGALRQALRGGARLPAPHPGGVPCAWV